MDYVYSEKENDIIEKAEDVILRQIEALANAEKPLTLEQCDGFTSMMSGLDRLTRMKGRKPS